jgi:hypothetical protein
MRKFYGARDDWDNWCDEDADAEADEEMDAGYAPRPVCGLF